MNWQSFNNMATGVERNPAGQAGIFRQNAGHVLSYLRLMISPPVRAGFCVVCLLCASLFGGALAASGQTNFYNPNGTEYPIIGSLPGDQVYPDVAVNTTGGFVVWEDNITDPSGWGISACQINGTLSSTL